MAVRKRGRSWEIDYRDPTGRRIRRSFKKKKEAEGEHAKRVSLIAEGRYLDVKKDYKTTLGELIDRYAQEYEDQPSWKTFKRYTLEEIRDYFGGNTPLSKMNYNKLSEWKTERKHRLTVRGKLPTVSTLNREMTLLHHLFRKGVEWDMMEKSPFAGKETLKDKENNGRKGFLSEEQIQKLLEHSVNDWIHNIVMVVLHTGMRRQEVVGLKRPQIRNGFIYLEKTKTGEAREIPINDELEALLSEIRAKAQLQSDYLFLDDSGRRLTGRRVSCAFDASMRRAGIQGFCFHDLRHTFASHFVMRGGSLKSLQEILGHANIAMTMRYAHLSREHKKEEINLLNGLCHSAATYRPETRKNPTI